MKSSRWITILAIVNLLLMSVTGVSGGAEKGRGAAARSGGKALSHMSDKGSANTNAQWSADPKRGWVRAEGRHQIHDEKRSVNGLKNTQGKQKKGHAKGKK